MNCAFSYTNISLFNYNNIIGSSSSAAAVICRGRSVATISSICEDGAIRLVNKTETSSSIEGILEVCDNGEWTRICYSNYRYQKIAELACKEFLGHTLRGNFNKRMRCMLNNLHLAHVEDLLR